MASNSFSHTTRYTDLVGVWRWLHDDSPVLNSASGSRNNPMTSFSSATTAISGVLTSGDLPWTSGSVQDPFAELTASGDVPNYTTTLSRQGLGLGLDTANTTGAHILEANNEAVIYFDFASDYSEGGTFDGYEFENSDNGYVQLGGTASLGAYITERLTMTSDGNAVFHNVWLGGKPPAMGMLKIVGAEADGIIASISSSATGSGYTVADDVTFTIVQTGGSDGTCTGDVESVTSITNIVLDDPGTGYSAGSATLSGSGGTDASVTLTVSNGLLTFDIGDMAIEAEHSGRA